MAKRTPKKSLETEGFTLVELAIVLVIIGLIIGGVLVGQDMIKSAEIRATISQQESFNTATNVFKDKYAYLPGDINQNRAIEFGFYDRSSVSATGNGDGNGLIQDCGATGGVAQQSCERLLFWRDLNTANLLEGFFQSATNVAAALTTVELINYFPEAKIGRGTFWMIISMEGRNYLALTSFTALAAGGAPTFVSSITPFEAYNIDRKMDDSRPFTGSVRAYVSAARAATFNLVTAAAPAAGVCVSNVDGTYSQSTEAFANTPACQVLRMPLR